MIANMRLYDFYLLGENNEYGAPTLPDKAQGKIKIFISISSQSVQDNVLYQDCSYVGITQDKAINDKYIIQFGEERLKVLYVNSQGRFTQVFLKAR